MPKKKATKIKGSQTKATKAVVTPEISIYPEIPEGLLEKIHQYTIPEGYIFFGLMDFLKWNEVKMKYPSAKVCGAYQEELVVSVERLQFDKAHGKEAGSMVVVLKNVVITVQQAIRLHNLHKPAETREFFQAEKLSLMLITYKGKAWLGYQDGDGFYARQLTTCQLGKAFNS